ncbi:MAG: SDR family oxidoreductase [Holophagales bacterium]|nr:SDR family oxidoreductase [Holophagales bacterium]
MTGGSVEPTFADPKAPLLEGRGIVVTGASRGLGKAIAEACLSAGADLCLAARDGVLLEQVRASLASRARSGQTVLAVAADVSRPDDVERLVRCAREGLPRLTGLVNNAGVSGPAGPLEETGWDAWVRTIEVNLLGTVLCCRSVVPRFRESRYGKIVNLSGGGATAPMPRRTAYAASKAAVVRFTESLAVDAAADGVDVNAVAPGALNTRMLDEILAAGSSRVGEADHARAVRQKAEGGASPERAADLCVFLLSALSDGLSGRLISAVWDPWESLSGRREALGGSDVFTLRRITPRDRGLDWG